VNHEQRNEEAISKTREFIEENTPIAERTRDFVNKTDGIFTSRDVYNFLQLPTGSDNGAIIAELGRLKKKGVIVKGGKGNGVYRKLENELIEMDFINAPKVEFDIEWPFYVPCRLYPGNVVICAGEPDSGKTSFFLNVVRLNMNKHDVNYFNCEMGAVEFGERLDLFEGMERTDWKFNAYERSADFADVIVPNGLNIVDYLDDQDAYVVKDKIKEIHNALDTGVALIALQKHTMKDVGYGGERTMDIPRLYLAFYKGSKADKGKVKVIKAKNRPPGESNPTNKIIRYKLVNGSMWMADEPWRYEEDEPKHVKWSER
jgi:hypothetical protein